MIERLQFIRKNNFLSWIFFLLILFLPTQFGKHFWPEFSFIYGQRVDYLSPTIYFTDIISVVFIYLTWYKKTVKISSRFLLIIFLIFLFLSLGIFLSRSPSVGWYTLVKFIEFIILGFAIKNYFATTDAVAVLIPPLSLGILFESVLAISQFIKQSSIDGIFYYFGERAFTGMTPGIANASLHGQLVLRPYATFSHPNVLAAYLVIGMTYLLFTLLFEPIQKYKKIAMLFILIVGTIALFLSLSRVAIILWICIIGYGSARLLRNTIFSHVRSFSIWICAICLVVGSCSIMFINISLRSRFFDLTLANQSVSDRFTLLAIALHMLIRHPFFGVGFGNFLEELPYLLHQQRVTLLLQPVHNIFMLIAAETGFPGLLLVVWLIYKTITMLIQKKRVLQIILLTIIIILGLFDHYFLTLQQGQLLLTFIFSFCWVRTAKNSEVSELAAE